MVNIEGLIKSLSPDRVKRDEPLSLHTTIGIGGPADLFYETQNSGELIKAVRLSRSFEVPVTIIGGGSNVLVSDKGVRGLVVRNKSSRIQVKPCRSIADFFRNKPTRKSEVVIDSGVDVDSAVDKLISLGIVGLEKMATFPGSIGAKIRNKEYGESLKKVSVLDRHGGVRSVPPEKGWEDGIVTDATFLLDYGDRNSLEGEAHFEKTKREETFVQSTGNVFEDISEEDRQTLGYQTKAVGFVIGEILNMKNFKVGKLAISSVNPNIIVNLGSGRAEDFIAIVDEVKKRARESIGLDLVEKVVKLGF